MALVLGLDIGTHSVTGAVFVGTPKKFRLVDYFREEIHSLEEISSAAPTPGLEYTPPPSLEELIQKILNDHNLKAADVVVAMDAKDCIVREIPVQFTKEEQISKIISFTAEEHLPTINVEDVVLEYLKIGEANGKSTVALFALRNDLIEARLALLKRAEIDPIALDLDAAALFNAFALTPTYDPKKATLLVDMGATSTKIVLVEDGRLKKVRAFRTAPRIISADRLIAQPAGVAAGVGAAGGSGSSEQEPLFGEYSIESRFKEIEEALKKLEPASGIEAEPSLEDFDPSTPIAILSDEDFERVQDLAAAEQAAASEHTARGGAKARGAAGGFTGTHSGGLGGEAAKSNGFDYGDYLQRISLEVQRTLASSRSNVELICLTGGMSARDDACRYLNEAFDVETIQLDFGDSIESDVPASKMEDVSRYGAVAIGLAVKELGRDQTGLDFRKGRFRYEHRFARLKFPLLLAASLLFAFFLQTAFWAYHENRRLTERADALEAASKDVYKAFFGKAVTEGREPLAAVKEQEDKWKGKGVGNVGKVLPYVDAVRNVAEVMNLSQLEFRVRNMTFDFRIKPGPASQGKAGAPKGYDSSLDITTKTDNAHLQLERKFKEPKSEFFDAKCASTSTKDGFQVTVTLTPKTSAMAKLE
jgi:hypothetical protein